MKQFKFLFAAVLLCSVVGCDIVNDDTSPRNINVIFYAYADKPSIISAAALSNGKDLLITGEVNPKYGKFEKLFDGKYFLYTPNTSFKGQEEILLLGLAEKTSKQNFTNLNLTLRSADNGIDSCAGSFGIYDYAKIKTGEAISIDLLDNDIFCGVDYNGGTIGILFDMGEPTGDEADFVLGPGRVAKFNYTPKSGFTGKVKIAYFLGINWKNPENSPVSSEEIIADPYKYLEAFTTSIVEIDVVSE